MSNPKYLVVEAEWLRENVDTVCCPERFMGKGFDIAPCDKDTDGHMDCSDCWIKYSDEIRPMTAAEAKAGELAESLKAVIADEWRVTVDWGPRKEREQIFTKAESLISTLAEQEQEGGE